MKRLKSWVLAPHSSTILILGVAFVVALLANTSFLSGAATIYPPNEGNTGFLISLFLYVLCTLILLLSLLCQKFLLKPVLIIFLMMSAAIAYFTNHFGVVVDDTMIMNVLETNVAEARDLFSWHLALYVLLLGVLPSWLVCKAQVSRRGWKREIAERACLAAAAIAILLASYLSYSANYASMFRTQKNLLALANPTHAITSGAKLIRVALKSRNLPFTILGADAKTPPADPDRELVIMVVGETARADHFSLNEYERKTNPLLEMETIINFPNFWSCGTSTAHSVPCMFSHQTREEFDKPVSKATDNALDILKRAGVNILWRDNNSSSKGVANRVTYEHFMSPEKNTVCNPECRDEGMLVGLQEFIDSHPEGDILIVLHTMGNHGPAYYKRYPARFEKFTPACKSNDMGSCSSQEVVNAYDNAILYTDYILSQVIGLLKSNDNSFETAMFYASDHGESLGENGIYLHGMPYFIAPDAQKHVPALMWFGKNFDTEPLNRLATRRMERLSHDNIFSTLIGLFEVRSSVYDVTLDILDHSKPEHW